LPLQGMDQVDVGLGEVGPELEGLLVTVNGLVQTALALQGVAQVIVDLGGAGAKAEGLEITGHGFIQQSQLFDSIA